MSNLTTRAGKGSPLTNNELDANFTNLNADKVEIGGDLSGTSSAPSVAKIQGRAVSADAPAIGEKLVWNGTAWEPSTEPTGEPIGHEDKSASSISFNSGTRTFTIAPVSANFVVWCKGVKYTYTSAQTVVIPDTTGLHFIYFNASGVLSTQMSYFTWEEHAPTAYVYWNATTQQAVYFGDERHGITLDWQTHEYLHRTRGAAIASGFGASGYTTTGAGATDADAQIDIGGGTFFDEDLQVDIVSTNTPVAGTWQQDLSGPARIPVLYLSGSAWVVDAPTDFPFKVVSGVPQYNLYSGGSWSAAPVANNAYFVSWILATHNLTYPVIAVISQAATNQVSEAEAMTFEGLTLSGFPSVEFRPLYKVIYQHKTSFANNIKASTIAVYDLRSISSAGVAAALVQDHGNLSGLGDDDHAQYLHVSEVRSPSTAVKNSFLPSQTSQSGKYLTTDGSNPSWGSIPSGSLTFTGDVTGSGTTGSSTELTLSNSGASAGTYTKVTVDAKGRVTSGSSVNSSDVTTALGFTPENSANKAVANGYASLDGSGKVPSTQLPSYVDDVLEYANLAALPATGESGKIYITIDTSKTYRWSGSAYVEISASPGSTDSVTEGSTNLYFTNARARGAITATGSLSYNNQTGVLSYTQPTNVSTFTNDSNYLTGITGAQVTTALGYTPYNATNPNGYTSNTGTVTSVSGTGTVSGLTLTGSVTSSGSLTLGGTLSLTSGQVTSALGYTPPQPNGTGATGIWGISISGNAATVTNGLYKSGVNAVPAAIQLNTTADNWMWLLQAGGGNDWYLGPSTANFGIGANRLAISSSGGSANSELVIERGTTRLLEVLQANLQYKSNVVLHAGNYNDYAPRKDGTGASGTWAINITGGAERLSALGNYVLNASTNGRDFANGIQAGFVDSATNGYPQYGSIVRIKTYPNDGGTAELYFPYGASYGGSAMRYRLGQYNNAGWTSWKTVLDDSNYSGYALSLSGGTLTGSNSPSSPILAINVSGSGAWQRGVRMLNSGMSAGDSLMYAVGNADGARNMGQFYFYFAGAGSTTNRISMGLHSVDDVFNIFGSGNIMVGTTTDSGHKFNVSGTMNSTGALTQAGSQVLHAGNYNDYAPKKDGTGANGTWGIRITGFANQGGPRLYSTDGSYNYDSANPYYGYLTYDGSRWLFQVSPATPAAVRVAYADAAGSASTATSAIRLTFNDGPRDLSDRFPNSFTRTVNFDFVGAGVGNGTGNYAGVMTFSPWTGTTESTGDSSYQLAFANNSGLNASGQPRLSIRNGIDTTWNAWYTLLHSGNYSSYALPIGGGTLTGTLSVSSAYGTMAAVKGSYYGYSAGYGAIIYGATSGNITPCFNVDPVGNASGAFSGTGNEVMFRNGVSFISPNAANNGYHNYLSMSGGNVRFLNKLSVGGSSTDLSFGVAGETHLTGYVYLDLGGTLGNYNTWSGRLSSSGGVTRINTNSFVVDRTGYATAPNILEATSSGYVLGGGKFLADAWVQSDRDFPNGTLITTDINYAVTNGDPFILEIRGNTYGNIVPLDIQYQGYIYSDTIINHGGIANGLNITGLVAINNGGNLCFWFPSQGYWNGYYVRVYVPYATYPRNRVTSITHVGKPTTAKEVALSANIRQSLHSGNYTNYFPTWSTGVSGNHIVQRDGNGYIYANHVNFNTGVENPSIANFITDNGDGWSRKSSLAHVKNSIRGVADGTWGISISGSAAQLNGYSSAENGASIVLRTASNGYLYLYNWIHVASSGLFSGVNGAHWHPTGATFGVWNISGSKGGYSGISCNGTSHYLNWMVDMGGNLQGWYNQSYGWQMYWSGGTLSVFKNAYGGGTQATVLDSSNYASYAGGLSTGNNWTAYNYFVANRNTTSDSPPLQAFSNNGSGAIMSFHRGGYYAVNFGLDSDNVMRIGGWSAGANRWQLDMSGNGTYAGNVTAYSDERLKKDWSPIESGFVDRLSSILAGTYTRIDSGERQAGVSAQKMREILPEVVSEDNEGTLALAYGNAAMVSAVELAKELVMLKKELAELKSRLH